VGFHQRKSRKFQLFLKLVPSRKQLEFTIAKYCKFLETRRTADKQNCNTETGQGPGKQGNTYFVFLIYIYYSKNKLDEKVADFRTSVAFVHNAKKRKRKRPTHALSQFSNH
jgi:hypothetical protein